MVKEGGHTRLLWIFSAPIMHETGRMGTAYALYDMIQDTKLLKTIQQTVGINLAVSQSDQLVNLISLKALPFDRQTRENTANQSGFVLVDQNQMISKISGFKNLYFQSSLESLIQEQKRLTLWIGLFSVVILAVSTLMAVFLSRKMVEPLQKMANKAIQISEGQTNLLFENNRRDYWEFNQLSEAFNYMITNLKDAEEQTRYKELLENVDDAVYIMDLKGNILEANESAYAPLGYRPEMFFELNLNKIIPENDSHLILYHLVDEAQLHTQPRINLETFHIKKNGTQVPVEIHSRAISYRGKKVILNVARDISKRIEAEKALRESEERYRQLFDNASDAVMIFDAHSKHFEDANSAATDLFGYTQDEFAKLTVEDISVKKDNAMTAAEKIGINISGYKYADLHYFKKKNGTIFPGEIYVGTFISNVRKKIIVKPEQGPIRVTIRCEVKI